MNILNNRYFYLLLEYRALTQLAIACLAFFPCQFIFAFTSTIEYYHYNHQGSLLEVYDGKTNKRLLSQAWSPWGERQVLHAAVSGDRNSEGHLLAQGLPVHMGYTGHKRLLATRLDFAGDTRLYDARLKRFLNSDDRTTGGVRGQNRYSYAYNNPMTFIDPDGRAAVIPQQNQLWRYSSVVDLAKVGEAIYANTMRELEHRRRHQKRLKKRLDKIPKQVLPQLALNAQYSAHYSRRYRWQKFIADTGIISGVMGIGMGILGAEVDSGALLMLVAPLLSTTFHTLDFYQKNILAGVDSSFTGIAVGSLGLMLHQLSHNRVVDPVLMAAGTGLWGGATLLANRMFLSAGHLGLVQKAMQHHYLMLPLALTAYSVALTTPTAWATTLISMGAGLNNGPYALMNTIFQIMGLLPNAMEAAFDVDARGDYWDYSPFRVFGATAAVCIACSLGAISL